MCTEHVCNRWQPSDVHATPTVPPWCQGLEETGVERLYPGRDSLINVGVWCKPHASKVLLEVEISGPISANLTENGCGWDVVDPPPYPPDVTPSHTLSSHWIRYGTPSGKATCSRRRSEASCHLLSTDTWRQFLLRRGTNRGDTMKQLLKCQWECVKIDVLYLLPSIRVSVILSFETPLKMRISLPTYLSAISDRT